MWVERLTSEKTESRCKRVSRTIRKIKIEKVESKRVKSNKTEPYKIESGSRQDRVEIGQED